MRFLIAVVVSTVMIKVVPAVAAQQTPPRRAAQEKSRAIATVTSFDSAGRTVLTLTSQRYLITRWFGRGEGGPQRILLQETSVQHCCSGGEKDAYGSISLSAWRDSIIPGSRPLWQASIEADEGTIWNQFYRTTVFGCCDSSDEFAYFNLLTGGPLFESTVVREGPGRSLRRLRVRNSSISRVIAFHDTWTPNWPAEAKRDSTVIGVLQYGSPQGPVTRVAIHQARNAQADYRIADIRFVIKGKSVAEEEAEWLPVNNTETPSDLTGFAIQVRLSVYGEDKPDVVVTIPVLKDTLDLGHAHMPAAFRLQRSSAALPPMRGGT
jgi:hypothetical protein